MESNRTLTLIEEEIEDLPNLGQFYPKRLELLKKGNQCYLQGRNKKAIFYYILYMEILCTYKKIKRDELHPRFFNLQNEKLELIILCALYWKISLIYDQTENLEDELQESLNRFKVFSTGFSYHTANLEILRKYIKTKKIKHKDIFRQTYKKMNFYSNQCYIATHCFGYHHPITEELRKLRTSFLPYRIGRLIISQYYRYSPEIVFSLKNWPTVGYLITKILIKPVLRFIAFIHKNRYI